MNKFKVGDKVIRTGMSVGKALQGRVYEISEVFPLFSNRLGINLEGHEPDENTGFQYYSSGFELCEENSMNGNNNKIKVGDTVRLKSGVICCGLNHMTQYLIERVRCKSVVLEGKDGAYDESIFIKVKSDPELIGEILTPLQAAEAIINKQKLQVFDTDVNKWLGFHSDLRNITLEDLKHIKLRHKPKTIIINGVEVPAPIETLSGRKSAFYIDLFRGKVQETLMPYDIKDEIMWATKEDAQKVLDAMLIPFKGD